MRMLLKVQMDTQMSNEAIKNGTLQKTMESALETIRPEAAYFTTDNGCRTAYLFFDLADPSQMPKTAEPFFLQLGAKISYSPVMNREDLNKGLAALSSQG
ncbi:hypothetical protein ACFYV5_10895 [Streptomyces sp. NPDC003035]|jgi:hypothetical protein|uniref:hypothetical protein n=1 Tax=unclassified Streptomyces TaxID=2593676 RepID=UPI0033B2752C